MEIIIITGFLGSGKTTLLLEIAKKLSEQGKKIAIIENEVGEVGIDDFIIKGNGYNVREIYSGCICCSLRLDLISTFLMLEREYNPDIIILEPSGVAGPKQVLYALQGYGGEIDHKTVVNIVDVSRFHKLKQLTLPLIRDGLATAELVVMNKIDLVVEEELQELTDKLKEFNNNVQMIPVSLLKDKNIDSLVTEILKYSGKTFGKAEIQLEPPEKKPEPAVYAAEKSLVPETGQSIEQLIDYWINFLRKIAGNLEAEAAVIGHVKLMFNGGKNGYCFISLTSNDHPLVVKGKLKETKEEIKLRINAITYNISKEKLTNIMEYS